MGLKEKIPAAEQLFVTDVDTELGPRQIRFYWGDISTLIKKDSVVIISTTCYRPKITGMAWRKILEKFPEIEESETDFKEVIISSPDSSLWPMGEEDHLKCVKYSNDEKCRFPPAILVSPPYPDLDIKRLFVVRSLPKGKASRADLSLIEKYKSMVNTCFPAIKAVEAQEQMHSAKPEAYEHVVLSALSGRQGYDAMGSTENLGLIFAELLNSAESWLRASPWWRCIDIVCWDPGKNKEDILIELRNSIGLEKGIREKPESLNYLQQEVVKALKDLKRICVGTNTFKGKDADSLLDEIERLDKVLSRDDLFIKEVGSAAGTLTEALVKWLARDIFGKGVALKSTFEKNIELLGESKENKPKVSKWVISFLQTLRVLRNCSAHAADEDGKHSLTLPNTLAEEDLTVLFANLKRVLRLLLERILQKNPS